MTRKLPTQERLRELFDYDAETGALVNRATRNPNAKAGDQAGSIGPRGCRISVDDKLHWRGTLVWIWHRGKPSARVLKRDRDRHNDRIENLRVAGSLSGSRNGKSLDGTLTHERLRDVISYDPDTGQFTRLVSHVHHKAGEQAGHTDALGYVTVRIDGVLYKGHRLAWFYVYGEWPSGEVDHIDGTTKSNAIANLREATNQQNSWNSRRGKANTSGVKGVFWSKKDNKWSAKITIAGKQIYAGVYDTIEEAATARRLVAERLHGEFARHD